MTVKRIFVTAIAALTFPLAAHAATTDAARPDPVLAGIAALQGQWAKIKYQTPDTGAQIDAIHSLEDQASALATKYPDRAEPKIWQGIILATDAGIDQGFAALGKVKTARTLFEDAIKIDPAALGGSAYTSLGSLYYQVPGWPIAFGNNKKAEEFLKKAVAINPDGIDSNYFYGDFLLDRSRYKEARDYLQKALAAPARPDRPIADAGRRKEIEADLATVKKDLK